MRDLNETTISAGSVLRLGRAEEEEIYSLYGLHLAVDGNYRGEQPGGGTDIRSVETARSAVSN
jgi:hypothetical protein